MDLHLTPLTSCGYTFHDNLYQLCFHFPLFWCHLICGTSLSPSNSIPTRNPTSPNLPPPLLCFQNQSLVNFLPFQLLRNEVSLQLTSSFYTFSSFSKVSKKKLFKPATSCLRHQEVISRAVTKRSLN